MGDKVEILRAATVQLQRMSTVQEEQYGEERKEAGGPGSVRLTLSFCSLAVCEALEGTIGVLCPTEPKARLDQLTKLKPRSQGLMPCILP